MNYPTFRRTPAPQPRLSIERPKRRDAELGYRWSKAAASYLRKNPFCAECRRHGRDVLATHVDHIVPRREGGRMWARDNWQPLCDGCEPLKRQLERLAVEMGNVQLLVNWMAKPESRPGRYAFVATPIED